MTTIASIILMVFGGPIGIIAGAVSTMKDGEKVGGYPAVKIVNWHKQTIFLQNMTKNR